MKINFSCNENLKQYIDSMLFDSDETIATLDYEIENYKISIDLMIRGEVRVDYKGVRYRTPSEFPNELKEIIKNDPHWTAGSDELYVDMNNWFEYIYDCSCDDCEWSDGVMFESDLSTYSEADLFKEMYELAIEIMED